VDEPVTQRIRNLWAAAFLLYMPSSFTAAQTVKEGFDEAMRGNYPTALEILHPLAEKGNADAQNSLGLLFANGKGVPLDYEQAAAWYSKAAAQGSAEAEYNLGVLYFNGRGVPKDYEKAAALYRKSAEQGLAVAQNNIGVLYNNGQGVDQDYQSAAKWYRKAAEQGLPSAESNIGWLYFHGQGITKDQKTALDWISKAARQGDISAPDYIALKVQPPTSTLPLPGPQFKVPVLLPYPSQNKTLSPPSEWFIEDTAYAPIYKPGGETSGYGLYSYVILLGSSDRDEAFLKSILNSTPPASGLAWSRSQINLLLLPTKQFNRTKCDLVYFGLRDDCMNEIISDVKNYDSSFARTFLYKICSKPGNTMAEFCRSSFGKGPFLLTYFSPSSTLEKISPPYLFIDLSTVDQGAFSEYIKAYKDQVKSEDVSDGSKINTLRLRILSLILSATGIINPVQKAIAAIMHAPGSGSDK
jgi:hypothetical protein